MDPQKAIHNENAWIQFNAKTVPSVCLLLNIYGRVKKS